MLEPRSAAEALQLMDDVHLARHVLGELFDGDGRAWRRAIGRVEAVAARHDTTLAFGAMLADLPASVIRKVTRRWGASNDLARAVVWMAEHLNDWPEAPDLRMCDFKRLMANPQFENLRRLWRFEERQATARDACSRRIARRARSVPPGQISPKPLVSGNDLIRLGLPEGTRLGRILGWLYDRQLDGELRTRRAALAAAKRKVEAPQEL